MEQSKKIEAHLADKSMDDGCNKVGHTTVLKYVLPTKEACEVFEGCKYYDSQTMTEAMQKSYLHHDNKLLGKYNDEDADTSSNSTQRSQIGDQSIFSQHLKVLPSCIHVQSRKAACPITVLCKDECDCLQCKNQTKPKCDAKTERLVTMPPNKVDGINANDRCCNSYECQPYSPNNSPHVYDIITKDECEDVCCAQLVSLNSGKGKAESHSNILSNSAQTKGNGLVHYNINNKSPFNKIIKKRNVSKKMPDPAFIEFKK
jgi:hypothetical protein